MAERERMARAGPLRGARGSSRLSNVSCGRDILAAFATFAGLEDEPAKWLTASRQRSMIALY